VEPLGNFTSQKYGKKGVGMAELFSELVICTKGPRYKIAVTAKFIFEKLIHHFSCFESQSSGSINPKLTLSAVLTKDQDVKVYLHINRSFRLSDLS
jgi:hypothetical protein